MYYGKQPDFSQQIIINLADIGDWTNGGHETSSKVHVAVILLLDQLFHSTSDVSPKHKPPGKG